MLPTQSAFTRFVDQIGSATVTFSPSLADALWIVPIKTAFTPGLPLVLTDADMADFPGVVPKSIAAGSRSHGVDPLTGRLQITLPGPIGGFLWQASGDVTPPQTIYGVALTSDSLTVEGADLLASALLPEPVTMSNTFDIVEFEDNRLVFNPAMVS